MESLKDLLDLFSSVIIFPFPLLKHDSINLKSYLRIVSNSVVSRLG